MSIELRQVEKWFPNHSGSVIQAIDKVDLSIADGEFVALLGPPSMPISAEAGYLKFKVNY